VLEDILHCSNLYWRYEDIQRRRVANDYERASHNFVLEALYTYVDEVLEQQGRSNI